MSDILKVCDEIDAAGESWLPVPGYETLYEVSSIGRVRRIEYRNGVCTKRRTKILSTSLTPTQYAAIDLWRDGRCRRYRVHRLVLHAFIGPPPTPSHHVNHRDFNRSNNVPENLEWVTRKENAQHALVNGHYMQGERVAQSKLNPIAVRCIRWLRRNGYETGRIARAYRINRSTVQSIINGRLWKHLPGLLASPPEAGRLEGGNSTIETLQREAPMPSDLKPTTKAERERWADNVKRVNEGAGVEWSWGTAILRLIADVERLTAALRDAERALEHFEHGAPRPNENAQD